MGSTGCVSYMFSRKGAIVFEKNNLDEDNLTMAAIDAGAEDVLSEESTVEVVTTPETFEAIRNELKAKGFNSFTAEITMVPASTVKVTGETAQKVLKLVNALEENDDVQNVYANFDISDEEIERLQ